MAAYEFNFRRKLQVFLIIAVLFFLFMAVVWQPWAAVLGLLISLLIVDCMFLNDGVFEYDPSYKNWSRKTTPKY